MPQTTNPSVCPRVPAGTFILEQNGIVCDLSELIDYGAKFTVLLDKYKHVFNVSARAGDKHYFKLYHALKRWEKQGLLEYHSWAYDLRSPELTQRRGVFVRATDEARIKPPNLIDTVQNSKNFARPENDLTWRGKIPNRCGWLRMHAIRRLLAVTNYEWFIRNNQTHALNPELTKKLDQTNALFDEWREESEKKVILLRNLSTGEFTEKPYRTRFTDEARKKKNISIYQTGIENSLFKWKTGVFLTLTTDPKLWLSPKGQEFTRYIKDDKTGKTYQFDGIGKGATLYDANRHESTAWRRWYEKITHQKKRRIPYIRCVEFQENGLIHTHVLLFDITWDYDWYQFAKEWGTIYGQGFMNKAYEIKNDGEKWVWKNHQPADAQNRAPADYLKKYLIKSMYDPRGFAMYWATNKRFFTMSETVRYYSFDEKIEEAEYRESLKSPIPYDYVGSCENTEEQKGNTIARYLKQNHQNPPAHFAIGDPKHTPRASPFWKPPKPRIEEPDDFDGIETEGLTQDELEWAKVCRDKQKAKHEYDWLF